MSNFLQLDREVDQQPGPSKSASSPDHSISALTEQLRQLAAPLEYESDNDIVGSPEADSPGDIGEKRKMSVLFAFCMCMLINTLS